jgi:protein ImuB
MVDRRACVDVFALPLQILLRTHPDWREAPAAVIEADGARAKILYANRVARSRHVREGMRYVEALAIVPDLRAGVIEKEVLAASVEEIARRLLAYSPRVEPSPRQAGVFWLDLAGMSGLYPRLASWVEDAREGLSELGYTAAVVVGFTRFGTYAVARAHRRSGIYDDPQTEQEALRRVPLERLVDQGRAQEDFTRLGLSTVADLLALPGEGLRRRYGDELYRLYRMAKGDEEIVEQGFYVEEPVATRESFDGVEQSATRLLFYLKHLVHQLLEELTARYEKLAALVVGLVLDDKGRIEEEIRPAEPTDDEQIIVDLLRLWLERIELGAGVVEVELLARGQRTMTEQLRLFVEREKRDLKRANEALARLRAELGAERVGYLEVRPAHLPEARARLVPLDSLIEARPRVVESPTMIRRFYPRPIGLSPRWEGRPNTLHHAGPHVVSGGWWAREVHRTYFFIEGDDGVIEWVYYDGRRGQWFLQGEL